jgi:hypothetical protein
MTSIINLEAAMISFLKEGFLEKAKKCLSPKYSKQLKVTIQILEEKPQRFKI